MVHSAVHDKGAGARANHAPAVPAAAPFVAMTQRPRCSCSPLSAVVRCALERAGHSQTRFRGWRMTMTYPVTLVEMIWTLTHPAR